MLAPIWRDLRQMHRCGTSVPKPSLPVRLALLVAGTTLPLILFATILVVRDYEQDRTEASQRVLETVRSIRLVLDAEMQRMTGGLEVVALTNALRSGDFDSFRRFVATRDHAICPGSACPSSPCECVLLCWSREPRCR